MLAREANVVIDDLQFAHEIRRSLLDHMRTGAKVVAKRAWRHQPLWRRVLIWSAYSFARLLMGVAGYGGKESFFSFYFLFYVYMRVLTLELMSSIFVAYITMSCCVGGIL